MTTVEVRSDQNFIDGTWQGADDGRTFPVLDPSTDAVLAKVPSCGAAETQRAIAAAAAAFTGWRAATVFERAASLRRIAELMLAEQERLARLLTAEMGKPLAEARGEVAYAAGFVAGAAGDVERAAGEMLPASARDKRVLILRQPMGVVAAITPWNFPIAMITRKIAPALAAGCTVVVKPAEQTPLSALAFAELVERAGLPAGVLNVITGDPEPIGAAIFASPTVRKVSFTGSTEVGKILMRLAAKNVTRLSLELGGHAPVIVFDDADLDAAVEGTIATKFRNAGQTCVCANRIYVQEGIYERFSARLGERMRELVVGPGTKEGVHIGPLIDDAAMAKVEAHVADAVGKGAKVTLGGKRVPVAGGTARFYAPTLLENVSPEMLVMREETFGPVAPLQRFAREDEAVRLANDTEYGLAAYFFTRDGARIMRVAEALDYGIVGANDGVPSAPHVPFGGVKSSGFGREGGRHGLEEWLEVKYVSWKLA